MKRLLKRALLGVVSLVVLLGIAWTIWNYTATRKLEEALKGLEEDGLPTSLSELHPPTVAPSENGAPYYRAAFALTEAVLEPEELLGEDGSLSEKAREALPRFDEALDLVYRAADRPRCDFALEYEKGIELSAAHVDELRKLAALLLARALQRARTGELDGAFNDLRVIFRVSRALQDEPLLISQLVRIGIATEALKTLEEVLPYAQSGRGRLEEVDPDAGAGGIRRGLPGDIACGRQFLEPEALRLLGVRTLFTPYLKEDLAFWLEKMRGAIRALEKPYPESLDTLRQVEAEIVSQGGFLVKSIAPGIAQCARREAELASRVGMARLAAELYDHPRREGAFSGSLEELPDSADTQDPLTGKPYELRQEEGKLFLVSQGDDELRWELVER